MRQHRRFGSGFQVRGCFFFFDHWLPFFDVTTFPRDFQAIRRYPPGLIFFSFFCCSGFFQAGFSVLVEVAGAISFFFRSRDPDCTVLIRLPF